MNAELKKLQEETGVHIWDGKVVVSSRDIAKNFGKRHDSVMRKIKEIEKEIAIDKKFPDEDIPAEDIIDFEDMFFESTYIHPINKQVYPQYLMTRSGFGYLAIKIKENYRLSVSLKYRRAFNRMEERLEAFKVDPLGTLFDENGGSIL